MLALAGEGTLFAGVASIPVEVDRDVNIPTLSQLIPGK
jgi:hypothetical protein